MERGNWRCGTDVGTSPAQSRLAVVAKLCECPLGPFTERYARLTLTTPFYLIDETALRANLAIAERLKRLSGARLLLALKCFASWGVFDIIAPSLDGTTSSSLNEVRLGREKFGGETHAYSVAYADHEIEAVVAHADKVIFNSLGQLERFSPHCAGKPIGLRLNPGVSHSHFALADPARPQSRLGEWDIERIEAAMGRFSGVMVHCHCENDDFDSFSAILMRIEERFGSILERLDWVSLGGGIHFTAPHYRLEALAERLAEFAARYGVQVYLEPGDAIVTNTASLETSVLDIVENGERLANVDASAEAHMLDLLIYRQEAEIAGGLGEHRYQICGNSCLAGDIFGPACFDRPLAVGDRISILNAAGYTMVKKNWFNGVRMPAIAVRRANGEIELVREFAFEDYVASLG
jgi:carboxynorspermidine decarboxylase